MKKSTAPLQKLMFVVALIVAGAAPVAAVEYERYLLPVIVLDETPGAHGSRWMTYLKVTNSSTRPVTLDPMPIRVNCFFCTSEGQVPPNVTVTAHSTSLPSIPASFLYVERDSINDVALNLRVQDLSRQLQTWGTELPIVRDAEFRTDGVTIVDVPTRDGFRQTLRIYGFDGDTGGKVRVRVFAIRGENTHGTALIPDQLVGETTVDLTTVPPPYAARFYPAYYQFNSISQIADVSTTDRVRLEVEPVSPGTRVWSFVSVTNNETQHVTTVTPKR